LNDPLIQSTQVDPVKLEEVKNKVSEVIFKECDSMNENFKNLTRILNEANHFKALENEFRSQVFWFICLPMKFISFK
jgi:hypothetical protein